MSGKRKLSGHTEAPSILLSNWVVVTSLRLCIDRTDRPGNEKPQSGCDRIFFRERQLKLADINHCLPIEQVSGELIEDYMIQEGSFDTVGECRYQVPSVLSIGRVY